MKKRTDDKRKKKRDNLEKCVRELHKEAREQDRFEVEKLWQQLVYPRGDVILEVVNWFKNENIPFMQCPFEAEAQCVKLQKDGLVQYVLSDELCLKKAGVEQIKIWELNSHGLKQEHVGHGGGDDPRECHGESNAKQKLSSGLTWGSAGEGHFASCSVCATHELHSSLSAGSALTKFVPCHGEEQAMA